MRFRAPFLYNSLRIVAIRDDLVLEVFCLNTKINLEIPVSGLSFTILLSVRCGAFGSIVSTEVKLCESSSSWPPTSLQRPHL